MTGWKKVLVAATSGATLVVMATVAASASGTGRAALATAGSRAVLMAGTGTGNGQPRGGVASGPGIGPIQVAIGQRWTLQGQLIVSGSVTITCGPFLSGGENPGAQVTVEEALADHVGHAQAFLSPLTCDGARHTYPVTALVSDVPFRPADGAASATAYACGQDPASFQFVCQQGAAISQITVK